MNSRFWWPPVDLKEEGLPEKFFYSRRHLLALASYLLARCLVLFGNSYGWSLKFVCGFVCFSMKWLQIELVNACWLLFVKQAMEIVQYQINFSCSGYLFFEFKYKKGYFGLA